MPSNLSSAIVVKPIKNIIYIKMYKCTEHYKYFKHYLLSKLSIVTVSVGLPSLVSTVSTTSTPMEPFHLPQYIIYTFEPLTNICVCQTMKFVIVSISFLFDQH